MTRLAFAEMAVAVGMVVAILPISSTARDDIMADRLMSWVTLDPSCHVVAQRFRDGYVVQEAIACR